MSAGGRIEAFFTVPSAVTISVTNNGGGPTVVTLAAGSYTPTSFCTYLQGALTAQRAPSSGAWSVSLSTGAAGTGRVTIAMSAGTFSITWTSTAARDMLGYTGTITAQTSLTATTNFRGLWLPGCHVTLLGDPVSAPKVTDAQSTEGPTGTVLTLKSTSKRMHQGVAWRFVTRGRTHKNSESPAYSSFESWLDDTQFGDGHAWFSVGSGIQVYWDNAGTDAILGADLNAGGGPTDGWKMSPAIGSFSPRLASGQWLGLWTIELPQLVAVG